MSSSLTGASSTPHKEKLLAIIAQQHGISRDEAQALCPEEYHYDYITWLTMESGCVSVWNQFIVGSPSPPQMAALTMLWEEGLYRGLVSCEADLSKDEEAFEWIVR